MSSKTYDTLKFIALAVTPVFTFICAIISVWGIPYAQQITASLAALETLIGALVVIAKKIYDKNVAEGVGVYGDGNGNGEGVDDNE